jgi:hypothetical protein
LLDSARRAGGKQLEGFAMEKTSEMTGITSISDAIYATAYSITIVILMLLWAS